MLGGTCSLGGDVDEVLGCAWFSLRRTWFCLTLGVFNGGTISCNLLLLGD